jgi:hypothetical protein
MRFAVPLDGYQHLVYSNPQQRVAIEAAVADWTPRFPRRLWSDEVAEFTRSAVLDFGPKHRAEARSRMGQVSRLVIHTHLVRGLPLKREIVFDSRNVETYIKAAIKPGPPAEVLRTRLFNFAGQIHEFDPARRAKGPRRTRKAAGPYSAKEVRRIVSQGGTRSTAIRRHNWLTLASFGAGFGLIGREVVPLTSNDLIVFDDHIEVLVKGDRARRVICRREWEEIVREVVTEAAETPFLVWTPDGGQMSPQRVPGYLEVYSSWDTSFSMERMRSTFIVRHLVDGTSLIHLMGMLGIHTLSSMTELIQYALPDIAPVDDIIDDLRGAERA